MPYRVCAALLSALLAMSCSGSNAPTAPTPVQPPAQPPPAPLPPPAPTVANIAGAWNGTMRFQWTPAPGDIPGQPPAGMYSAQVHAELQQAERSIAGTWRITTPNNDGHGEISGRLEGAEATTTFSGTVTWESDTHTGTGRCRGTATFSGSAWGGITWESPSGWDYRGQCYNTFSHVSWQLRAE